MDDFRREFLEDCEGVSNVKILCKNGIVFTHKIIVASSSNFIKNILLTIPFVDDITLFLPHLEKNVVEHFLNPTLKEEDIFIGTKSNFYMPKFLKADKQDDEEDNGKSFTNLKNEEKYDDKFEEFLPTLKEEVEDVTITPSNQLVRQNHQVGKMRKKKHGNDKLETNIQLNFSCEDLEKELIPNPTTSREEHKNYYIHKKIAIQKALDYFLSDESISIRAAAMKFNISDSTLGKIIKHGKSYISWGKKSKVLTEEEEKIIVNRVLEFVRDGQQLDQQIVRNLLSQEIEMIKVNFPERSLIGDGEKVFVNFCYSFVKRHNLNKYFPKDKVRHYQCDVCFKSFTFKNALVKHQKVIHYSFLNQ